MGGGVSIYFTSIHKSDSKALYRRNTHSSGKSLLVIPATAIKIAKGAFRYAGWPDNLELSNTSLSSFKETV